MSKVYGYCRISTKQQSIERQIRNIKDLYPTAVIVEEVYTGTKIYGSKEFDNCSNSVWAILNLGLLNLMTFNSLFD